MKMSMKKALSLAVAAILALGCFPAAEIRTPEMMQAQLHPAHRKQLIRL